MLQLATCRNYADLNSSMLRMRGHVSAGFFAMTSYSCKVNIMAFVILLQVRKVNFFNRWQMLKTIVFTLQE